MRFDDSVVKIDCLNSAYDEDAKEFKLGPAYKVFHRDDWYTGVALHKWTTVDGSRKGNYVAISLLKEHDNEVDCSDILTAISSQCNDIGTFTRIENGDIPDELLIVVYKFSVNIWRPVINKKTKWVFDESTRKPLKGEPSYVQRLLKN